MQPSQNQIKPTDENLLGYCSVCGKPIRKGDESPCGREDCPLKCRQLNS